MKPWTISRGNIKATEVDVQKAAALNALLIEPASVLPSTVEDDIKPFAVGIFDRFRARLRPGTSVSKLRRATAAYVHTRRYYLASAQPGALRHNLDGQAVEPVSESDRMIAQSRFIELKQKHATTPDEVSPIIASHSPKTEQIRASLLTR